MMRRATHHTDLPAFNILFAHYVAGHISDTDWQSMMKALDDNDVTPQERVALAAFFRDLVDERRGGKMHLPKKQEVRELLTAMRRAA